MKTFSITDVGRCRDTNQDYVYTSEMPVGKLPNLYIVADGMGGHNAGDLASKYAVEQIVKFISENQMLDTIPVMRAAIADANIKVLRLAGEKPEYQGMGTTIVMATIADGKLTVANVGDSRLYLINEHITQITEDHSLVQELVKVGKVMAEEAAHHPDKNMITRAVGAVEQIEVDFFEEELPPDTTILMCTDGLSNMVEDSEMYAIVKIGRDVVEKTTRLVEAANRGGGKDNITVAIIEA